MSIITAKVKSRGYWRIRVRPADYIPNRIANISDLYLLIQRLSVDIRGWDFPHVDADSANLGIHQTFVSQEIDWENFIEAWRFYQSGQFAYLGALHTDWPSRFSTYQPDSTVILIDDSIARYAEALEFAARLSATSAGSDRMWIQIGVYGLGGRNLAARSPLASMFLQARTTTARFGELIWQEEISREQLLAESEQIALRWARELFRRFNWDPDCETLKGIRGQFGRTKRAG